MADIKVNIWVCLLNRMTIWNSIEIFGRMTTRGEQVGVAAPQVKGVVEFEGTTEGVQFHQRSWNEKMFQVKSPDSRPLAKGHVLQSEM